jgi:hypothetical protein
LLKTILIQLKKIIMAHSNEGIIAGKLRGLLGKELVFRNWEGKTVVAKAPKARSNKDLTPGQQETQEKFLLASRYAKAVLQDPAMKDGYAAVLKPRQNVYARAVTDFLSAPVIKTLNTQNYTGAVGDQILVRAYDDFRVTGVRVEIYAADGILLEQGAAIAQLNGLDWSYTAMQTNAALTGSTVKAIATDVPGNEGILVVIL